MAQLLSEEMKALITKEIELNGVLLQKHPWLSAPLVVEEIIYNLVSELHEGKIVTSGVVFAEDIKELGMATIMPIPQEQFALARRLSNGIDSFVLYERDRFIGLAIFPESLESELRMIRVFPASGGLIVQRNAAGVARFFQGNSIILHENRIWFTKPHVKEAVWKVMKCVSGIDRNILSRILEFSFHLLSPWSRLGATLVWFLKDARPEDFGDFSATRDLSNLGLSILDERQSGAICHLLSQVDGATYLSPKGTIFRTSVHLKYSEKSGNLIKKHRGTRHTSAQRFSYDKEDTLVVTVSEDGPVNVYSSGANIADLGIHPSHREVRQIESAAPEKKGKVSNQTFELACEMCGKNAMIEQVSVEGWQAANSIECPTCQGPLYSAECFRLECRPFKQIK